jgi:hypothetical protein
MKKFLPLVGVLVFGIGVLKLFALLSAPWLNHDASALDVVMMISLLFFVLLSFVISCDKAINNSYHN